MKSVMFGLLAAVLLGAGWVATGNLEAPPVTIIEIPVPTTTTPALTTTPPATTTPATTSPSTTDTSPVTTSVAEQIPVPTTTEPESSTETETAGGSDWIWRIAVAGALIALAAFSLYRDRPARRDAVIVSKLPAVLAAVSTAPAAPISVSKGFQAIEYRTGGALGGSEVRSHSVAKFSELEPAIEAARQARAKFDPGEAKVDVWWVVWDLDTQRAAWIAEYDTPGERVIDLRYGRSVAAAKAESDLGSQD